MLKIKNLKVLKFFIKNERKLIFAKDCVCSYSNEERNDN